MAFIIEKKKSELSVIVKKFSQRTIPHATKAINMEEHDSIIDMTWS